MEPLRRTIFFLAMAVCMNAFAAESEASAENKYADETGIIITDAWVKKAEIAKIIDDGLLVRSQRSPSILHTIARDDILSFCYLTLPGCLQDLDRNILRLKHARAVLAKKGVDSYNNEIDSLISECESAKKKIANGFIFYHGGWVTEEERDSLLAQKEEMLNKLAASKLYWRNKALIKELYDARVVTLDDVGQERAHRYLTLYGAVGNISGSKIANLQAVAIFYDKSGSVVKNGVAFVEYQPLMPDQHSPFEITVKDNPAISSYEVVFKQHLKGAVPHIKISRFTEAVEVLKKAEDIGLDFKERFMAEEDQ